MVDGKADAALVKALDDRAGIRRAVAAVTLRRGGIADHFPAVRKLLLDKDIEVRRRVALDLAEAGDNEGAVTLSDLLENLPDARAWEIEEQLERLAGGKAPAEMTANPIDWKKVAGAWRQWWQGERGKVVMTDSFVPASGGSLRGYTLLVQPQSNTITELGPDGKPRWTLTGLQGPIRCPGAGQSARPRRGAGPRHRTRPQRQRVVESGGNSAPQRPAPGQR